MGEIIYEKHSDEKDYIYFRKNEGYDDRISSCVEPHFHNAVEIKLLLHGDYSASVGSVRKEVCPGELVFINSRQIHSYQGGGEMEYCTLVFDSRFLHNVCGKSRVFQSFMPKHEVAFPILRALVEEASSFWRDMEKESKIGFLYRFIGTIMQYYGSVEEVIDRSENIAVNIIQYIQSNYCENLTLDSLAERFGYTRTYFSYLFNKYVGMSLRDYLNRLRVDAVMQMVAESPELPLYRAAEKVGYKSWVTFYRAYRKYGVEQVKKEGKESTSRNDVCHNF